VEGGYRAVDLVTTYRGKGWTIHCRVHTPASEEDLRTCEAIVMSFRVLD